MADVSLEAVGKSFGRTQAVDDLTLTVKDGEFLVLLGPTGAGKTTTLRLIAGLERPDRGRVTIGGVEMTNRPPADRDVAFVFQQYSLYPHYSVYDNLASPLRSPLRRWSEDAIKKRVEEVASLLRIESKLANRATRLSGGEMQRVAIGRALVRNPACFLMDEPLSSLDAKLREDLRVELKRIQLDLGATILYVTHDQIEAMTLADRIGVLSEGRLVQIGTPRQVYAEPESIYVANRLGSPRINILPLGALGVREGPATATCFGLRPEDVLLGEAGQLGRVIAVERLGADTIVVIECEGQEVHALAGPGRNASPGQDMAPDQDLASDRDLAPGQSIAFAPRMAGILFFDNNQRRVAAQARQGQDIREPVHGS